MVKSKLLACCFAVPVCLLFFFLEPMVDPDRTGMEWNGMEWNGMMWAEWNGMGRAPSFLPSCLPSFLPSFLTPSFLLLSWGPSLLGSVSSGRLQAAEMYSI